MALTTSDLCALQYVVFDGGAVCADLTKDMPDLWFSKAEYDEVGASWKDGQVRSLKIIARSCAMTRSHTIARSCAMARSHTIARSCDEKIVLISLQDRAMRRSFSYHCKIVP